MPGFDGTGPLGKGPMSGRGEGFCVFIDSEENSGQIEGLAGIQGRPVHQNINNLQTVQSEMMKMPYGKGTEPAISGPIAGTAAGFRVGYPRPGYMNATGARRYAFTTVPGGWSVYGLPVFGHRLFFGAGRPGYGSVFPRRGFGHGRGSRSGRGRFGGW